MKKEIAEFQLRLQKATHITPLLKSQTVSVIFKYPDDTISINIHENEIRHSNDMEEPVANITIEGTEDTIKDVLEGNHALRKLENQGSLIIKGPLRDILWLESLFLLSREYPAPSAKS